MQMNNESATEVIAGMMKKANVPEANFTKNSGAEDEATLGLFTK